VAGAAGDPERDARPVRGPVPDEGGDPVCWLHRVCPACGRIADEDPPTRCPACGGALPAD
jgi:rubrerythrin